MSFVFCILEPYVHVPLLLASSLVPALSIAIVLPLCFPIYSLTPHLFNLFYTHLQHPFSLSHTLPHFIPLGTGYFTINAVDHPIMPCHAMPFEPKPGLEYTTGVILFGTRRMAFAVSQSVSGGHTPFPSFCFWFFRNGDSLARMNGWL
ncbi:hypothetical protein BDQ94DRAFT_71676 [Aspergillus welwitschiae]|uniref:Uncharacterized protein n=1 Tax=Aspergillus welwitschiae TaxID=1341132 RepID=A0A3F3QFA1_9EURO|nr:hypothetical protein BDQ94DRAFT_71676 [Aspergillus welwitschiae]RDH37948.1 hypothetical protein BDQ94DRAFT_71676 [Aspergillus welwitschiae]